MLLVKIRFLKNYLRFSDKKVDLNNKKSLQMIGDVVVDLSCTSAMLVKAKNDLLKNPFFFLFSSGPLSN